MKPAALALVATLAFASCQDADKSYDAIHGPENVLMAPLASEDNRQQDATNRMLWEKSLEDSAFYAKREHMQTASDSASRPTDTAASGKDNSAEAGVNPSGDTHPRVEHETPHTAGQH